MVCYSSLLHRHQAAELSAPLADHESDPDITPSVMPVARSYDDKATPAASADLSSPPQPKVIEFGDVAVLPAPADNCGVARCDIARGALLRLPATAADGDGGDCGGGAVVTMPFGVLVGHRFTVAPLARGDVLLSWGPWSSGRVGRQSDQIRDHSRDNDHRNCDTVQIRD